ncbi:nicotinate-nucleotide--dimethylbenzimidazole phosphoribosyltransferase [Jiella sp. MQZ9-1]|uniref:Nicotinate-nucleotide--dimethylbenzimidazole phosphoribosyltransferase n=1 Tax=Jiella flava TaxID=2816857 RepID=A0A939FTP6_9HYPH|nr:nicotinate-nucleotide--dimethylbenzimidazole phosphoribosyltransferase [Jiella flava]MBO0661763.1 nicotinate-nucleotide--dimethylbenzimidazole phosphoribosyltransferase [Jiella flava]MCD2470404.1 nicotinate-nucleotide--dimethylbenzimidazole phosphoribosyltransferase [Jiella flava]
MSTTGLPFDDIRDLVRSMPGPDTAARHAARHREEELTKPSGSLGRLEEISEWLAAWQGGVPHVDRPLVAVFAGNHGVTAKGISAFPADVTVQMVANFAAGGAAINQICAAYDMSLKVYDLALEIPTDDFTEGPAMDERTCAATMAFGMEVLMDKPDLLCIGEMGIGNTTIAAAIYAALFGGSGQDWAGAGTGLDSGGQSRKAEVIDQAIAFHNGHLSDPLEVLRRLGGREIAGMAGAILGARHQKVPVVVDGFVATSAAAVLYKMDPHALDHCLFGHVSAEQGHIKALEAMGKVPLLALGMRLGEGTGAALAAGIVKAAARCHRDMATFAEAAVSNRD